MSPSSYLRMAFHAYSADIPTQDRKTLISLQWLVVIGTSYLSLFSKGQLIEDPRAYSLIAALLASVLVLYYASDTLFGYKYFPHTVVIVDTTLITIGITLSRETPWDLFLVFFFCLFIAAIGENLTQVIMGCLIVSVISVVTTLSQGRTPPRLDPDPLLRIPFIFGVSILYGYLAEEVKREKRRAEEAEKTIDLKRQLVSALAHDIKNPLVVINVNAQLLSSALETEIKEQEKQELFQGIQENVRRILNLITSFLDVSMIEGRKVNVVRRPVQLNHLIREVAHQHLGVLRKKNLSLEMDLDEKLPEIMADESQLERVLWNLVSNGIKYTSTGRIALSSQSNRNRISVSVKDSGMGIPEEELSILFREFQRGRGATHIGGSGLGLFIVKTIVEAHGGTVDVKSRVGQGSIFTLHFPVGT